MNFDDKVKFETMLAESFPNPNPDDFLYRTRARDFLAWLNACAQELEVDLIPPIAVSLHPGYAKTDPKLVRVDWPKNHGYEQWIYLFPDSTSNWAGYDSEKSRFVVSLGVRFDETTPASGALSHDARSMLVNSLSTPRKKSSRQDRIRAAWIRAAWRLLA